RTLVDGGERARRDPLQLIHEAIGPARVDGTLEVPIAPVVRDDQSVPLHRAEDHPHARAEPTDRERSAEPEPRPHRRTPTIPPPGGMSSRPEVAVVSASDGHPDRMIHE